VYDGTDGQFKLNEVVEFIGVLSITPQLAENKSTDMLMDEDDVPLPPTSVLPRLHCICHRKLSNADLIVPSSQLTTGIHVIHVIHSLQ
jgi:hypothetical protein